MPGPLRDPGARTRDRLGRITAAPTRTPASARAGADSHTDPDTDHDDGPTAVPPATSDHGRHAEPVTDDGVAGGEGQRPAT